jgi:hypothetical protein
MPTDASRFSTPQSDACANLLRALVEALREATPRLNQDLPFPQRTGIASAEAGEVRSSARDRCSLSLTVRLTGGVEKGYVLTLGEGASGPALTVSDGADFEEHFRLASPVGRPPEAADVQRLFAVLTDDLGLHFATES